MIIVTGAGGRLGSLVVEQLLGLEPPEGVGVSVRDPGPLSVLEDRGVRVRRGDFADPDSLAGAFEGATTVLVVSVNAVGGSAVDRHRAAFDTAVAAGAKRIVYTSHMGAGPSSEFAPMTDHAATETALADCGVGSWTSVRNGFYASTVPMLLRGVAESGELRVPEDAPVAWTAHEDLAAAIARVLVDDSVAGATAPLTGPDELGMADVAAIASRLYGRPVRHVVVPDEEYRQRLLSAGLPEQAAATLVGMFAAARRGDFGPADPTLARITGRAPLRLEDVLRATPTG